MVITCFNFVIAHPIITPNSVIGKFMYTRQMTTKVRGLQYEQLPLPTACQAGQLITTQPVGIVPILQIEMLRLEIDGISFPRSQLTRGRATT